MVLVVICSATLKLSPGGGDGRVDKSVRTSGRAKTGADRGRLVNRPSKSIAACLRAHPPAEHGTSRVSAKAPVPIDPMIQITEEDRTRHCRSARGEVAASRGCIARSGREVCLGAINAPPIHGPSGSPSLSLTTLPPSNASCSARSEANHLGTTSRSRGIGANAFRPVHDSRQEKAPREAGLRWLFPTQRRTGPSYQCAVEASYSGCRSRLMRDDELECCLGRAFPRRGERSVRDRSRRCALSRASTWRLAFGCRESVALLSDPASSATEIISEPRMRSSFGPPAHLPGGETGEPMSPPRASA
jgi:hypothetical protein